MGYRVKLTQAQQAKADLLGVMVEPSSDMWALGTYYVIGRPGNDIKMRMLIKQGDTSGLMRFKTIDEAIAGAAAPHKVGGEWK